MMDETKEQLRRHQMPTSDLVWMLDWRFAQMLVMAGFLMAALPAGMLVDSLTDSALLPLIAALVTAAAGVPAATVTISGRTVDQWVPIGIRYLDPVAWWRARRPVAPDRLDVADRATPLRDLSIVGWEGAGLILDGARDGAVTGMFRIEPPADALIDPASANRNADAFEALLEKAVRVKGVDRLGWYAFYEPQDAASLIRRHNAAASGSGGVEADVAADLLADLDRVTAHTEVWWAVTVNPSTVRTPRNVSPEAAAADAVLKRLEDHRPMLEDAGYRVAGVATPAEVGTVVRSHYDPAWTAAAQLWDDSNHTDVDGNPIPPVTEQTAWPTRAETQRSRTWWRTGSAYHQTWRVEQWSPTPLSGRILNIVLGAVPFRHAISVVCRPVPVAVSAREAKGAYTDAQGEAGRQADHGYADLADRRRRVEAARARDEAVAAGQVELDAQTWITVSVPPDADDTAGLLEDAAEALVAAAVPAGMMPRPQHLAHHDLHQATLPCGRGVGR